ncbi:DoxX family protein [Rhodococcus rhodnii]|uniref:DoxX family protein n=1 Tax=Rhodococcus rhodnii LMG 5362 TaxID=1273125 RepID=R7WLR2_9NOCA|nr:DoxX family protein [Rhodococcus rhodnii]EOM76225.1 hypothetical protein Rrhod_2430 [Rhodococcus rhodnii LMG 5362]
MSENPKDSTSSRPSRTDSAAGFDRQGPSPYDDQPTERVATVGAAPTEQFPIYGTGPTEVLPTSGTPEAYAAAAREQDTTNPTPAAPVPVDRERLPARRGTLDLGLLALRVAVGAILLVHGLQKLAGLWGGPGLDGYEQALAESGFDQARVLAIVGAAGETAAGALLILGLLTPWAAAGALALMINAWAFRQAAEPGLQFFAPDGIEYETLLGVCAGVIVLTGPGRIALDGRRGWATRPFVGSLLLAAIGIAAGVAVWVLLNGANPLV